MKILFLHHSTGKCIWNGGVPQWFVAYNKSESTDYQVFEREFPKRKPYGWENYPFDYWKIWVKNGGRDAYMEEPTLEMLCRDYDIIIFKHCYPVSRMLEEFGEPQIDSNEKTIGNYKLQYNSLKEKMHSFAETKFILWTASALVSSMTTEEQARRSKEFYDWVIHEWDEPGDNIFLWDFRRLETGGGLYLPEEHAGASDDSHPNPSFSRKVAPFFCRRIVDVIEGRGDTGNISGT